MPARKKKIAEQLSIYDGQLPPFTSTQEEIKRAVERGAIHRGGLLTKIINSLKIDEVFELIKTIKFDKEDIYERRKELNIDENVLVMFDNVNPPISYLLYFTTPEFLIQYPELVMYYRNVAMLSKKVMRGIGLPTDIQEDKKIAPSVEFADELAKYFNGIVSKLILMTNNITPNRHLEMVLSNIGDALGGVSRNEVGRYISAEIMHYLITYWYDLGYLESIQYTLKRNFSIEDDGSEGQFNGDPQTLLVTSDCNISQFLETAEANRVKYQGLILKNGNQLLLDRQLTWQDVSGEGKSYRIGPDMVSKSVSIDMAWAGEVKGGADPAGSDEHWKTATQALNRILEAAEKTGRPQPKLSLLATILVDRVALEAQQWINDGKLTSAYNLTKIAESKDELQRFLDDMTEFLGYSDVSRKNYGA